MFIVIFVFCLRSPCSVVVACLLVCIFLYTLVVAIFLFIRWSCKSTHYFCFLVLLFIILITIFTYWIGHYNTLVRIGIQLFIPLMLCVLFLSMSSATYRIKATPNDRFFERLFMAIFSPQRFYWKVVEKMWAKKYFFTRTVWNMWARVWTTDFHLITQYTTTL